jgi:hypothetical protein
MGARADITLGSGILYLNNVDVGHLAGPVTLSYHRRKLTLQPSGSGLTTWRVIGTAALKAASAEFSAEHLRLALGLASGNVTVVTGCPSYNPASFAPGTSSTSYDTMRFGGDTIDSSTTALRFEHTRPQQNKKIVVVLYTAVAVPRLELGFNEDTILRTDMTFLGLRDETRPAGDQIGMVLEEQ